MSITHGSRLEPTMAISIFKAAKVTLTQTSMMFRHSLGIGRYLLNKVTD
jgi:hypothetical protein